ncbi:MAG TPA: M6 family metalloprotease domain-containing protein [Verrucomicrobiae bacterium]|nr:M6 family metalloprotease domain-containing protein [Verrucomicrobiae bacterium]
MKSSFCRSASWAGCVLLVLLSVVWVARGAPFSKRIEFRQPDGTTVVLWGQGDEFYAVFETLDGYTVVFDAAQRAYCYARLSADGTQLLSTGTQVQNGNGPALGLPPHLRLPATTIRQQVNARRAEWDKAMEISPRWAALKAAAAGAMTPSATTLGTKVGLTLLIDFSDDPATMPQAQILDYCNGDNFTAFGNNGSVKKYYSDASNGRLTYSNMVTLYVRAPHPKPYYNDVTVDAGTEGRKLISDALAVMKALPNFTNDFLPLFSNLTTDNQNRVVAFNVFYAGGNGNVWSMGLWPHSWSLASPVELSPGGKKVYFYQISNIGTQLEIGTFCHENGHMLCSYPDLYDYTGASQGVGQWCLMAGGSWGGSASNPGNNPSLICAYLRRVSGWATTVELTFASAGIATVSAAPGTNYNLFYRYAKPGVATEYYLAECRYRSNHDAYLPGSGVAIWHIDELGNNSTVNLNPNTQHDNYEATLVQADNHWDMENNNNGGDSHDPYFRGNSAAGYANSLTDSTSPKASWWDGSRSGLVLRDFSSAALTMTFAIGTNPPVPTIVAQPASQTVLQGLAAAFTVGASGAAPLAYQWYFAGAPVAGATDSTCSLLNVQPAQAGGYSVVVTNSYGSVTSAVATLTVIPAVPLAIALNNTNLAWTTDTNQPWYGQTDVSHDGIAAARSYFINPGQQTSLRTTVAGPGTMSFWWRCASPSGLDTLAFASSADLGEGSPLVSTANWSQQVLYLPAGAQTLQWTYARDASSTGSGDMAIVDQVTFASGATLPFITVQPSDRFVTAATPAVFAVVAGGTPALNYQWRFNGRDIGGATNRVLTLASPTPADAGLYSVLIANAYGQVLSVEASLGLLPFAALGDDSTGQLEAPNLATDVIAIAAGSWHTLALGRNGRVLAWGENYDGQCNVPANLGPIQALAGGGYHSLALRRDGTVVGWGANGYGQATPPAALARVVAIAAGSWHSLALRADGSVVAWGDNSFGESSVPPGLAGVAAIAAAGYHSLALLTNGTVVAWGDNTGPAGYYAGQSTVPTGLTNAVAIGAGAYHSLAVMADGSVAAWGDNSQGQCQIPPNATNVLAVTGGSGHTLALRADSTVVAWGNTWQGQASIPAGFSNVVQFAAGDLDSLLLVGNPFAPPELLAPVRQGTQLSVLLQTVAGRQYTLEWTPSLPATWTAIQSLTGTSSLRMLMDATATGPHRLYRVRQTTAPLNQPRRFTPSSQITSG